MSLSKINASYFCDRILDEANDQRRRLTALLDAQIELNAFINRSVEAFSYDDGIRFVRQGERLEIIEVDAQARAAWRSDGDKLNRLHQYWLYRGMDALMASPIC